MSKNADERKCCIDWSAIVTCVVVISIASCTAVIGVAERNGHTHIDMEDER